MLEKEYCQWRLCIGVTLLPQLGCAVAQGSFLVPLLLFISHTEYFSKITADKEIYFHLNLLKMSSITQRQAITFIA